MRILNRERYSESVVIQLGYLERCGGHMPSGACLPCWARDAPSRRAASAPGLQWRPRPAPTYTGAPGSAAPSMPWAVSDVSPRGNAARACSRGTRRLFKGQGEAVYRPPRRRRPNLSCTCRSQDYNSIPMTPFYNTCRGAIWGDLYLSEIWNFTIPAKSML